MELSAHEIEFRKQRLAHLEALKAAGHRPYGRAFERTGSLAEVRAGFAEGRPVRIAGPLVAMREMGKSIFAHLQDGTDKFQIYVQKNALGDESVRGVQAAGPGRPHRRGGRAVHHAHGRAVAQGAAVGTAVQGAASAAGEVARAAATWKCATASAIWT